MQLQCSQIAAATGGRLVGPDVTIDGASIDSRTIRPGQLFVPIVAERDGHGFIPAALAAGAAAYLTTGATSGGSAIVVEDTTAALQAVGRLARSTLGPEVPVIGITGSVGKTSVKDLLAGALAQVRRTTASERNFNNELGVPLTLLAVPADAEAVVVEMGARGVGHIAELCAIATPTIGVVTRVAAVHTEVIGTIEDVARTKAELVESLSEMGTAVLNADDPRVLAMTSRTRAATVTFGQGGDVHATGVTLDDHLRPRFHLGSPWGEIDVALGVRGLHQVENSLAAATVALVCGLSLADVASGLAVGELSPGRMEMSITSRGVKVINDAYNASPTSMAAALESLSLLPAERRVAVLGVMAELDDSERAHADVALLARRLDLDVIAVDAPAYGPHGVEHVDDIEGALAALAELGPGDAVLVKGSRVAGLERVAEALLDE